MPHNDSLKDQLKQVPVNLADARHHAGLSCAALAKACEVTERTIRNYECGRARFEALVVLLRISKATGTSLDTLIGKRH